MAFADGVIAAMTVYCEASGEPQEGRIAVAATFFNRLKSGRFGKSVAAICLARYQYSEWNDDKLDNANLLRAATVDNHDSVMADCAEAFNAAASGMDPSLGATHYYADTMQTPPAWAAQGTFTVQIGHHRFYKNVP